MPEKVPLTEKDVPVWLRIANVDHILLRTDGWNFTACGTMTNEGERKKKPKRKCRRCMAELPKLRKVTV